MDVQPIPGLEHLPYAEVWFHAIDERSLAVASDAARALGKTGLEAWTTTRTPEVAAFLAERGYTEARRYVISEVDVGAAPDLGPPQFPVVTLAERPDLVFDLFALAQVSYADQPGRAETRIDETWFDWGLRAHPPEAYFVALADDGVLGYGYLEREGDEWRHGFMAVTPAARGRGVAGAIKRAQLAWAKANGVARLRTATEVRLASMRALNEHFGYVPVYEEIVLRGPLSG